MLLPINTMDIINKYGKAFLQKMLIGTSNLNHYDIGKQKFVTNMNDNV